MLRTLGVCKEKIFKKSEIYYGSEMEDFFFTENRLKIALYQN